MNKYKVRVYRTVHQVITLAVEAENEAAVERAKTIILEKARDRKDWAVPEYAADNLSEEDYTVEVVAEAIDISIAPAPVVEPKPAKVKKTKKVRTKK